MSKQKSDSKPAKKGMIINRKHNRTVNFDVAQNEPRWTQLTDKDGNVLSVIMRRITNELLQRNRMTGHWEGANRKVA